jgi:hypothetical protein
MVVLYTPPGAFAFTALIRISLYGVTTEERKQLYAELCDKHGITSLFMQPWWLNATGAWDVCFARRNGRIIGAMPFALKKSRGFTLIGMPVQTHHLRIWMDKPPDISEHKWLTREKQIIWLLVDDLPKYTFFSMVFEGDSFSNWLPFHWRGFRQEMRYTFIIDREMYESEDHGANRNLRRNIRDAQADLELSREIDLPTFQKLCASTFQRQGKKVPYSLNLLESLDTAIAQHDAGIRLCAQDKNGKPIAASWLLWDADKAYYFMAGDVEEGRLSGASILLCHEAIRIAFEERQVRVFDFCGSMIEPITEIRRQFGAKPMGLMKIFKARWKLLDMAYALKKP